MFKMSIASLLVILAIFLPNSEQCGCGGGRSYPINIQHPSPIQAPQSSVQYAYSPSPVVYYQAAPPPQPQYYIPQQPVVQYATNTVPQTVPQTVVQYANNPAPQTVSLPAPSTSSGTYVATAVSGGVKADCTCRTSSPPRLSSYIASTKKLNRLRQIERVPSPRPKPIIAYNYDVLPTEVVSAPQSAARVTQYVQPPPVPVTITSYQTASSYPSVSSGLPVSQGVRSSGCSCGCS